MEMRLNMEILARSGAEIRELPGDWRRRAQPLLDPAESRRAEHADHGGRRDGGGVPGRGDAGMRRRLPGALPPTWWASGCAWVRRCNPIRRMPPRMPRALRNTCSSIPRSALWMCEAQGT